METYLSTCVGWVDVTTTKNDLTLPQSNSIKTIGALRARECKAFRSNRELQRVCPDLKPKSERETRLGGIPDVETVH